MAQWKRAGPITQRSVDRNYALLDVFIRKNVRMAEWSKALRSGRSPLLWAWVRIPLLTNTFLLTSSNYSKSLQSDVPQPYRFSPISAVDSALDF